MNEKIILRVVSKFLIPYILLFALYVQWHGDFGPGGGFPGGRHFRRQVHPLRPDLRGRHAARGHSSRAHAHVSCHRRLTYGLVGVATLLMGGKFLDYNVLAGEPTHGQHLGILLVELGVGITVAAAMITIFCTFAGRAEANADDEEEEI